ALSFGPLRGLGGRQCRQKHFETGASSRGAVHAHSPAVPPHDSQRRRKTEVAPREFGREERIEDLGLCSLIYSRSRICVASASTGGRPLARSSSIATVFGMELRIRELISCTSSEKSVNSTTK